MKEKKTFSNSQRYEINVSRTPNSQSVIQLLLISDIRHFIVFSLNFELICVNFKGVRSVQIHRKKGRSFEIERNKHS